MSEVRNIKFNLDLLPSVLYLQFKSTKPTDFTSIDLSAIDEDEHKHPLALLAGLKGDSETPLNLEKLLLVKLGHGIPDGVYGASLYRESSDSNSLVVRFGQNTFPVTIKGKEITVGNFTGEFSWETKKKLDGTTYQKVWLELVTEADPYTYYTIPLAIPKEVEIKKPVFTAALNSGQGIAHFLKPVPVMDGSGFSHTFSLEDLEIGEYRIEGIEQYKKTDTTYGLYVYKIFLEGGVSVFAKGKSLKQMGQTAEEKGNGESNKAFHALANKIKSGIPHKLSIVDKREWENANGKHVDVTHAIVRGLPSSESPALPTEGVEGEQTEEVIPFDWRVFAQSLGITPGRIAEASDNGLEQEIIDSIDINLSPASKHVLFEERIKAILIATSEETGETEIPASVLPY